MPDACRWIRRELSLSGGVAPSAVIIVSPGSIPKTPSGKLQPKRLGQLHRRGELAVEVECSSDGGFWQTDPTTVNRRTCLSSRSGPLSRPP